MKWKVSVVAFALALTNGGRLWAKSDTNLGDTLKWIEKHRPDFQVEWRSVDGPTKYQPEDFKNFAGSRDIYWDRTIKWTARTDGPRCSKDLDPDGESYSITSPISFTGDVTDKSENETTKDAASTLKVEASYTWRLKLSQVSPDPVVLEYKEYLRRTNETDNVTVDLGMYYYVCIVPKEGADKDAILEIVNDQRTDDGLGHVSVVNGHRAAVSIAGVATVYDRKMADRLATAIGHLITLLRSQNQRPQNQAKEPF